MANSVSNSPNIYYLTKYTTREVPEPYSVDAILNNLNKVYAIDGRSYQIQYRINRGDFGDVYLAFDVETRGKVAIKVLRHVGDMEHYELKKMHNQGGHLNIVKYIGSGTVMEKTWIVMEYIQGEQYGTYIKKHPWTKDLEKQYQDALDFLEQYRLKSKRENEQENMLITMIDGKPTVKLIDFGTLAYD